MTAPSLSLTLLGGCRGAFASGAPLVLRQRKPRALLAYLALSPGAPHPRERLATLLWDDVPDAQARQNLRQAIRVLRGGLARAPAVLVVGPEALALDPCHVKVDVWEVERLAARQDGASLRTLLTLCGGELLQGLAVDSAPFVAWLGTERERLRVVVSSALGRLLRLESRTHPERAALVAGRLLALDPCDEAAHRALMQLEARQGRASGVRRQYQACVAALAREVGAPPSTETRELYQRLAGVERASAPRAAQSERGHVGRRPAGAPTLVGRELELARLRALAREAAGGTLRMAFIVGEAGVGKSRLLSEVAAVVARAGGRTVVGHAYESEQILPYGAWIEAIETSGALREGELVGALPPAARAALGRLVPALAQGSPAPASEHHRSLFEALALLVRGLGGRPLVLILEDLHWADEMTVRLLPFLARRLRDSPVLLVATLRDEEPGPPVVRTALDELAREPSFARLELLPLSRSDTVTLARRASSPSGVVTDAVAEAVWRASEGNPWVVIETIRGIAEGAVSPTDALPVTPRVQELIAARLARLPETARALAVTGAVIGRPFEFGVVQGASGLPEADAVLGLETLVQRRFVRQIGDRLTFTHDRVRQAILAALLPARRGLVHGAVARALETVYAGRLEPHHAAIAVHAREAGLWPLAARHFRAAGRQALARSARREALECFQEALRAIAALPEGEARAEEDVDARLEMRGALFGLGQLTAVARVLDEAEAGARRLGDSARLAWVELYRAFERNMRGRPVEALAAAQRARTAGAPSTDVALAVGIDLARGHCLSAAGQYRLAAESFARVLEATAVDRRQEFCGMVSTPTHMARASLPIVYMHLGEFERGTALGREALALADAAQQPLAFAHAALCLATLHIMQGRLADGWTVLERACRVTREWDVDVFEAQLRREQGLCLALSGRTAEGLALLDDAQATAQARDLYQPAFLSRLGWACLLDGQIERALEVTSRCVAIGHEHGQRGLEAWAHRLLGEIRSHDAARDDAAAEAHYGDALAIATERGMRPLVAHCHAGLGRLARRRGRRDAGSRLGIAAALYREMGMTLWLDVLEGGCHPAPVLSVSPDPRR